FRSAIRLLPSRPHIARTAKGIVQPSKSTSARRARSRRSRFHIGECNDNQSGDSHITHTHVYPGPAGRGCRYKRAGDPQAGNLYRVTRVTPLVKPEEAGPKGIGIVPIPGGPGSGGFTVPLGYQGLFPGSQGVTIEVPKDRPIPIADVVARLGQQAHMNLRVD